MLFLLFLALASTGIVTGQDDDNYGILNATRDLGDLNIFSAALQKNDLVGTLNNDDVLQVGNNSFVVFAPNDQAFQNLPTGMLDALYNNAGAFKDVLNHHIADNDDNRYGDLTRLTSVETRMDGPLNISNAGGLTVNGARVLGSREYDNGVVYVIDRVLMPANAADQLASDMSEAPGRLGILQALKNAGNFNRFSLALQAADRVGWLNGEGGTVGAPGPFTIFAPTDDAFAALPTSSLNALMTNNQSDLRRLIEYHVIEDTDVANTTAPQEIDTAEGGPLNVDVRGNTVSGARILNSWRYSNGIIYAIDRVLLPGDNAFLTRYGLLNLNATGRTGMASTMEDNDESLPPQR
ncbi:MAG TPA: fasciclin domain-containing protein [Methanotrichaceae archaeon]|nr:fasciclin domain-containing protein [Methanotrichaceae archaeon]